MQISLKGSSQSQSEEKDHAAFGSGLAAILVVVAEVVRVIGYFTFPLPSRDCSAVHRV
jgi:hypothetical protein